MFDDRIELYSPGALPNMMQVDTMTVMSLPRNDVLCSLFATYYPVHEMGLSRNTLMDRRGMGVKITLDESEKISGKRPVYENIGDMELKLSIFAAPPPPEKGAE
jgi:predicted HTH transcriptional regulator